MKELRRSVYIIAEAGVNHNGNMHRALELVRVAKRCGADAVKFQIFQTEENISRYCPLAEYQTKSGLDRTTGQLDLLRSLELSREQILELARECATLELDFLATPDDDWALDVLRAIHPRFIKIASAELDNRPFLERVGRQGSEVILSTGMGTMDEVRLAVGWLEDVGTPNITLLHCTSNYPTQAEDVNVSAIMALQQEFKYAIGYSDHTIGSTAGVMAVALGASVIEKHITLDTELDGPDHKASADPISFSSYVASIREAERVLGDGEKLPVQREQDMRIIMRRSLVAGQNLAKGTVLSEADVKAKRPGGGLSPKELNKVIGKRLKLNLSIDKMIHLDMLE